MHRLTETLFHKRRRPLGMGTLHLCQLLHVGAVQNRPTLGHGTAIAADIREFAEAPVTLGDLRDSGLLTDEEFNDQKERLLAR
jgi:hypothetical protein